MSTQNTNQSAKNSVCGFCKDKICPNGCPLCSDKKSVPVSGCPFCRSKKLPWANHTISNCRNLKKNKCEYCGLTGHAVSHCQQKIEDNRNKFEQEELARRQRWEENQRLKEQEKVRKEEEKKKQW